MVESGSKVFCTKEGEVEERRNKRTIKSKERKSVCNRAGSIDPRKNKKRKFKSSIACKEFLVHIKKMVYTY